MEKRLIVNLDDLSYEVEEKDSSGEKCIGAGKRGTLPWGVYQTPKDVPFLFSGRCTASRGGAWYWRLPGQVVRGYGKYQPYLEFLFSGEVEVTSRRDTIPKDGWGWRQGDHKWVYLRGVITPIPEAQFEASFGEINLNFFKKEVQGRLAIYRVSPAKVVNEESVDLSSEEVACIEQAALGFGGRRKIYNHQFFGTCRVFWLGKTDWLVIVSQDVQVVSPDHLTEPLALEAGWYFATHPAPTAEGVD